MTPESEGHGHRVAIAAVVAILLVGGVALYYFGSSFQQDQANSSTISSLQQRVSDLQKSNAALQAEVVGLSASNASSLPSDAQTIYSNVHQGIVTIQSDVVTTTNTFFGSSSSVSVLLGSGFVTTYSGSYYIVTNYHVIDGASNITVTFTDGNAYPAQVVGDDPYSDLAVVSVNAPSSEYVPLGISPSSNITVGQTVYVIGNPYGLSNSMTFGIVSQLGRTIQEATTSGYLISGIIQFSAPINPGNSGGPLLDSAGRVIGITTAVVSGSQGVGFAIPSDTILRELSYLITTGKYTLHSSIGISAVDMSYGLAKAAGTNVTYGVLVEHVNAGGAAAKAGLVGGSKTATVDGSQYLIGGDIIVSINGTKIINQDALSSYLEGHTVAGQTIILGIIRSGNAMSVSLVLDARPPPSG